MWHKEIFWHNENIPCIYVVVRMYKSVKTQGNYNYMHFIVYKLYLTKVDLKLLHNKTKKVPSHIIS